MRDLGGSDRVDGHIAAVEFLRSGLSERAHIPKARAIDTQSNLSVRVFRNIVTQLGVPYRVEYEAAEKSVLEPLLSIRNDVAHGARQPILEQDFERYYQHIDDLLVLFCNDVDNAAAQRKYLVREVGQAG